MKFGHGFRLLWLGGFNREPMGSLFIPYSPHDFLLPTGEKEWGREISARSRLLWLARYPGSGRDIQRMIAMAGGSQASPAMTK
jgi:hypothetical protein